MANAISERDMHPLVLAASHGDGDAFARLVEISRGTVTSIAMAICRDVATSEDIAQEVYLVAWRRLKELRNPASFLPWVRQITRYTARTWVRDSRTSESRRTRGRNEDDGFDTLLERAVDPKSGPEASLLDRERERVLGETLDALPDESREVVLLFYREGRSSRQVAALLGLGDAAVRKRLERARRELRQEVLGRFAEAAQATAPGAAFTAAVLASTASAPVASAATVLASTAGTPAGASTQPGLWAKVSPWLGGAGLGFLGGAAGVILGLRKDFRDALDDHERSQLRWIRGLALGAVFAACVGFSIPALQTHWTGPVTVFAGLLMALAILYSLWLPRILRRRFMAEENGDLGAVERRLAQRQRWARLGWLLGALCGTAGLVAGMVASGLL